MCFTTDGIIHHWRGRRAWRAWDVSPDGLGSPIIDGADPVWKDGGIAVFHETSIFPTTKWTYPSRRETREGLYASSRKPRKLLSWEWAHGSVLCFGPGYVSVDGLLLTAESMVIERVLLPVWLPTHYRRRFEERYPFVHFVDIFEELDPARYDDLPPL